MRRALASVVVVVFAGLLGTSVLAVFHGANANSEYLMGQQANYPYFVVAY